jgi:hypothetical protein
MATPAGAVRPSSKSKSKHGKQQSRGAYSRACQHACKQWEAAGHAPKSRQASMSIIASHLKALGNPDKLVAEFEALKGQARSAVGEHDAERLDSSLLFLVWDLTKNKSRALNYDTATNFFSGLLRQASTFIYSYTRVPVVLASGRKTTMPTVLWTPGGGAQRIIDIPKQTLEDIASQFIDETAVRLERWKPVGADADFIKKTLKRLEEKVLQKF